MKKRLHDKKAGVAILCVLLVLAVAEVVGDLILNTEFAEFNLGEPFATLVFATMILFLGYKKKDRICYICYGAWISWFVVDQIFSLPGMIATLFSTIGNIDALAAMGATVQAFVSIGLGMAVMICIIAMGALLLEYMHDGTIHNKAFNTLCVITVLLLIASVILGLCVLGTSSNMIIYILNNLSRIAMVLMFAFFAYDSAKLQLKKVNFSK